MKKKQHLDVSYKYFLRVRSFYDFNEILNEILSVVFLDIKKTRESTFISDNFCIALFYLPIGFFLKTTLSDLPRIRAGSCHKHLVT